MRKNRYSIVWDDPLWMSTQQRISEETAEPEESRKETSLSDSGTDRPGTTDISERPSATENRAAERQNGENAERNAAVRTKETPDTDTGLRTGNRTVIESLSGETERNVPAERSVEPVARGAAFSARTSAWNAGSLFAAGLSEPAAGATAEAFRPADPTAGTADWDLREAAYGRSGDVLGRTETGKSDRTDIERIVDERLSSLRVYVLESDITEAQNSVKTMVARASF